MAEWGRRDNEERGVITRHPPRFRRLAAWSPKCQRIHRISNRYKNILQILPTKGFFLPNVNYPMFIDLIIGKSRTWHLASRSRSLLLPPRPLLLLPLFLPAVTKTDLCFLPSFLPVRFPPTVRQPSKGKRLFPPPSFLFFIW